MPINRYYSSVAQPTTLSGSVSAGATSLMVGAATGFPATTPFTLALDYETATEELVEVTAVAGTSLTVTRGIDGTSAQSHSLGAPVRHVVSARDFAEFQTHQAATSAIHGVAGTLVGTSDTQTLSNKTLSSPTVNTPAITNPTMTGGGSLSGTYTGTPTFSGAHTHTSSVAVQRANASDLAYASLVTGDANGRYNQAADGSMSWGDGTAARDTFMSRAGSKVLGFADTLLRVARTNSTDAVVSGRVTGDANSRWYVEGTGKHWWANGTGSGDTNLYRLSGFNLATDSSFTVGGNISAANFPNTGWTAWTPAWSTTTGINLPSYGNAVIYARYTVIGKTFFYTMQIVFGSSTNFGGGGIGDNWTFTIPGGLTMDASLVTADAPPVGHGRASQSLNNTCPIYAFPFDSTRIVLDTAGGKQDGNALANPGNLDAVSPWTWVATDMVQVSGFAALA